MDYKKKISLLASFIMAILIFIAFQLKLILPDTASNSYMILSKDLLFIFTLISFNFKLKKGGAYFKHVSSAFLIGLKAIPISILFLGIWGLFHISSFGDHAISQILSSIPNIVANYVIFILFMIIYSFIASLVSYLGSRKQRN